MHRRPPFTSLRTTQKAVARLARTVALALAVVAITGCASGPTETRERFYLAVPSGDNVNFFRLSIEANTFLGVTKYQSGWFPADTVDRLYGDTSDPSDASALVTEQNIKNALNEAIEETMKGYLEAARDPDSNEETVARWLLAQRRVRSLAGDQIALPNGAVEIEYDPTASLALRHAGEKLVLVLSSNPDEIMKQMSAFAGNKQTSATVLRLADVVRKQAEAQVLEAEARSSADSRLDAVLVARIDSILSELDSEQMDRDGLLDEVRTLLITLENLR